MGVAGWHAQPHVLQALNENTDEDGLDGGGTLIVPGFHNHFDKWTAGCPLFGEQASRQRCEGGMQFSIPEWSGLQKQAVRVTLREGSLLIWDQRCIHGSSSNSSARIRCVATFSFLLLIAGEHRDCPKPDLSPAKQFENKPGGSDVVN
jgi:ectoine hydroxylase-related dioxygenase (phytanoyl-CoA dioxygenase family)